MIHAMHVDPAHEAFTRLPREHQARIYYFNIGWNVTSIADELNTRRRTVRRWLDADIRSDEKASDKVKARTEDECERDYSEVCSLHRQGKSPKEIIAKTGIPRTTVYRVLKDRFGSLRRQRGEDA